MNAINSHAALERRFESADPVEDCGSLQLCKLERRKKLVKIGFRFRLNDETLLCAPVFAVLGVFKDAHLFQMSAKKHIPLYIRFIFFFFSVRETPLGHLGTLLISPLCINGSR